MKRHSFLAEQAMVNSDLTDSLVTQWMERDCQQMAVSQSVIPSSATLESVYYSQRRAPFESMARDWTVERMSIACLVTEVLVYYLFASVNFDLEA